MDPHTSVTDTANDRFKRGFGDWFWYSIAGAAVLHLVMFAFWPTMSSADMSTQSDELTAVDIPDQIEIPPPPEQIARPATPVISAAAIDEDITISPTTFDDNPIDRLPPPPTTGSGDPDLNAGPVYVPRTVEPEFQNRSEIQRALVRNYPPMLRDAGIGGRATVWFLIDERGRVVDRRLSSSSGYAQLDEAAMAVAEVMRFSPAYNREDPVKVWVELPITFNAR